MKVYLGVCVLVVGADDAEFEDNEPDVGPPPSLSRQGGIEEVVHGSEPLTKPRHDARMLAEHAAHSALAGWPALVRSVGRDRNQFENQAHTEFSEAHRSAVRAQ